MSTRVCTKGCYVLLNVLFMAALAGCGRMELSKNIQVTPAQDIEGGKTGMASIQVRRAPADAKFVWRGNGVEVRQTSDRDLSVQMIAPSNTGPDVKPATVTFEVQQDGRTLDSRIAAINVTPELPRTGGGKRIEQGAATTTRENGTGPEVIRDTFDSAERPSILLTEVPPVDGGGRGPLKYNIKGTVTGVKAEECAVVISALTTNWFVQPYANRRYTKINDDLTWSAKIRGGREYAAVLVKRSFTLPPEPDDGNVDLPKVDGKNVLAMTSQPGT